MLKNAVNFVKKFTRSLSFKLSFYAGLVMFLALLAFSYHTISSQEAGLIKKMIQDSIKDSEVIKAAIWNGMMKKERGVIRQIINAIGKTEGFKEINIYDDKGFLHYTTSQSKAALPIDMSKDPFLSDLRVNTSNRHKVSADGYVLTVLNPLINTQSCSSAACHAHPESEKILGAVELKIGLDTIRREISQNSYKTIIFATALFVVVCTISGTAVLLFVNPSIKNLQRKAFKMARGEYVPRAPTIGKDEIAELGRAFDSMSVQINQHTAEIESSRRMYKALFEEVPCYLTVIDRNFKIIRSNRMF